VQSLTESTREFIDACRYNEAEAKFADFLADGRVPASIAATVRSLRRLCSTAAEHQRLAAQLEVSAYDHRLAGQELRPAIDGLLATLAITVEARGDDGESNDKHGSPRPRGRVAHDRWDSRTPPESDPAAGVSGSGIGQPVDVTPGAPEASVALNPSAGGVSARSTAAVEVRLLGSLEVAIDGRRIARWGSLKTRALFGYLAIHRERPVRRDVLMEAFWPGYVHGSARNNLNVSLYNLRRTLEDERAGQYVLHADGCYLLNGGLAWWIDRDEFLTLLDVGRVHRRADRRGEAVEAFRMAVDVYRGPLLEDDTTSEWHLPEQRRLEALHLQALEQLAELYLEMSAPALAEQAAQRALGDDPCRESTHRLLMRCYAEQHQQHLVSRQLRLCETTLRHRLDIAPARETVRLFETLTSRG
jgi:DNA-binding SARP family transcriptional activator